MLVNMALHSPVNVIQGDRSLYALLQPSCKCRTINRLILPWLVQMEGSLGSCMYPNMQHGLC